MSMNLGFNPAYGDAINAYNQVYAMYMDQQMQNQQASNQNFTQNPQNIQYGPAMQYPQNQVAYQQPTFQGQDAYITQNKSDGVSTTTVVVGIGGIVGLLYAIKKGKIGPLWNSTKKHCKQAFNAVKNWFTKKGAPTIANNTDDAGKAITKAAKKSDKGAKGLIEITTTGTDTAAKSVANTMQKSADDAGKAIEEAAKKSTDNAVKATEQTAKPPRKASAKNKKNRTDKPTRTTQRNQKTAKNKSNIKQNVIQNSSSTTDLIPTGDPTETAFFKSPVNSLIHDIYDGTVIGIG